MVMIPMLTFLAMVLFTILQQYSSWCSGDYHREILMIMVIAMIMFVFMLVMMTASIMMKVIMGIVTNDFCRGIIQSPPLS
jgi:hypothetical protein